MLYGVTPCINRATEGESAATVLALPPKQDGGQPCATPRTTSASTRFDEFVSGFLPL